MELINFMFRLGVLLAIYGFIWALIELALAVLSANRRRGVAEVYIVKALKYIFLADVTFLFCVGLDSHVGDITNNLIIAGLLLFTYFIGKIQSKQNQQRMVKVMGPGFGRMQGNFNMRAELVVIGLAFVTLISLYFFPDYSRNPVSNWFYESIINIEDTPIFGFIFKVVGFFFVIALVFRFSSAIGFILSGEAFKRTTTKRNDSDRFDDFTEVD